MRETKKLLRVQRDFATSQFLNKGIFLGDLCTTSKGGRKGEIKVNNTIYLDIGFGTGC